MYVLANRRKLLYERHNEAREVLAWTPESPFRTLALHTLAALSIKSKAAFEAILKGYEPLLQQDLSFYKVESLSRRCSVSWPTSTSGSK